MFRHTRSGSGDMNVTGTTPQARLMFKMEAIQRAMRRTSNGGQIAVVMGDANLNSNEVEQAEAGPCGNVQDISHASSEAGRFAFVFAIVCFDVVLICATRLPWP